MFLPFAYEFNAVEALHLATTDGGDFIYIATQFLQPSLYCLDFEEVMVILEMHY